MKRFLIPFISLATLVFLLRCTGESDSSATTLQEGSGEKIEVGDVEASDVDLEIYYDKGAQSAQAAFKNLSSKLKEKLQSEGPAGAVAYCQVEADRLTTENVNEVLAIQRVSINNRNPENAADEKEVEILKHYRAVFEQGESPKDTVVLNGEVAHYYRPIMVQPLCLNCHGVPNEQILPETLAVIDSLYPADKARNYRIGDLRGVWHVAMAVKN